MACLHISRRLRQALPSCLAGFVVGWLALCCHAQAPQPGGFLPRVRSFFTPAAKPAPRQAPPEKQAVIPPVAPRPVVPPLDLTEQAEPLQMPAAAPTQEVKLPIPPRPVLTGASQAPATLPQADRIGQPEVAPTPRSSSDPPAAVLGQPHPRVLPISLDTVLRLVQHQNGQIAIARERVEEAYAGQEIACRCWLPVLEIGPSYWRHEGGIQDFTGRLIHSSYGGLFAGMEVHGRLDLKEAMYRQVKADQDVWKKKGDLSETTSTKVLEASWAYLELQGARLREAISVELEGRMKRLIEIVKKEWSAETAHLTEVPLLEAELAGQQQVTRKMQEATRIAAARLIYLLGLDPCAELQVMDTQMGQIKLVDVALPVEELVKQAVTTGPGVRELEGMLSLLNDAMARSQGPGRLMPALEVRMVEGAFGAGPGASLAWDNRFDIMFNARWNITAFATANAQLRKANSQLHQVQLEYNDLRARLTSRVQSARESTHSAREQARQAEDQIARAREAFDKSYEQMKSQAERRRASQLLMIVRALGSGQANYLQALLEFNRAQMELFVLTGQVSEHCER